MTITSSIVADYVAGRLDKHDALLVEAAASIDDSIALQIWDARDHVCRVRRRLKAKATSH